MGVDYNLLYCKSDREHHHKQKSRLDEIIANFNKPKRPRLERINVGPRCQGFR